jgi:hypothetical protein
MKKIFAAGGEARIAVFAVRTRNVPSADLGCGGSVDRSALPSTSGLKQWL